MTSWVYPEAWQEAQRLVSRRPSLYPARAERLRCISMARVWRGSAIELVAAAQALAVMSLGDSARARRGPSRFPSKAVRMRCISVARVWRRTAIRWVATGQIHAPLGGQLTSTAGQPYPWAADRRGRLIARGRA